MSLQITLEPGAHPAEQIRDQIRGLVATGRLAAGERLPSVRQLAADLGIAAGTVAKAYRGLEAEGVLETRVGSGTRVTRTPTSTPLTVVRQARALARASRSEGMELDETARVLRAVWDDGNA